MKIGLSSWAFRYAASQQAAHPLTHVTLLDKASALGADVVQICDNMPLDRLDDESLRHLRSAAEQRSIVLEVGTTDTHSTHVLRFVEIAHLLGAHILRVAENMSSWQPSLGDIAAELGRALPACRQHDVTIAIENHFSLGTNDLAQIVQTVNDPHVGICLDTVNSIARLEGWREVVTALSPYAVSLHLKDAGVQRTGVGFYIGGRALGQGMVDVPFVLQQVARSGRQPNALLELWMDPLPDMAATIRQEEQWIADSLAYLRQVVAA